VWFRLNVGREKNADPRWLLPLICRQGKITKQDIGAIRIFERETKFEIDAEVAPRFAAAIRQLKKPDIRIEPLAEAASDEAPPRERRDAKPPHRAKGRPDGKPFVKGHWKAKDGGKKKSAP
jgi:ATP-dependent RNA helicase DeaD